MAKETLYGGSKTTRAPYTSVTAKEPKQSTSTTQALGGFFNPDGTTNQAAMDYYDEREQQIADIYGINRETGRVDPKYVTDILGVDPAVMRKKREDEEALNRMKQKSAAWYDALAVMGDIATTAAGGDVWQRAPHGKAKAAHDANLALEREQLAEDAANAKTLRAQEKAYANAIQKLNDSVARIYSSKVVNRQDTGGGSRTTRTPGVSSTSRWHQVIPSVGRSGSGSGSGSGNGSTKTLMIQVTDANGNPSSVGIQMPANEYKALGGYLSAAYGKLSSDGKKNIDKVLQQHNIRKIETGVNKGNYDGEDLLTSGVVFDDPQIRSEFIKAINGDNSLSQAEKSRIIESMRQYPTDMTEEKRRSWLEKVESWFDKEEEEPQTWGTVDEYDF